MMNRDELTTNCVLSCGCHRILVGERRMGEVIYCRTHRREAIITSNLPEYWAVCQTPRCKYSKPFGQAPVTAVTKGSTHSIKYRHTVHVFHGHKLVEEIGSHHQQTLPGLSM
jgi:hypothetical protein